MPTTDQPSPAMVRAAQIGFFVGFAHAHARTSDVTPTEAAAFAANGSTPADDAMPYHVAAAQRAQQDHPATPCRWTEPTGIVGDMRWTTDCGNRHLMCDGEQMGRFCKFCGAPIEVVESPTEKLFPRPMIQVAPGMEGVAKGFLPDFARQAALGSLATHRIAEPVDSAEPSRNPCQLDSQPIDRPARAEGGE